MSSLPELQRWLAAVMTSPGGLPEGLARAHALTGLELRDVVRSTDAVPAEVRVGIYARGYLARLLECMRADYPATRALLGEALFDRFATGYLWSCRPRGYSMFAVGQRFPAYLEQTRPPDAAAPPERRALLDLPIDLARVERARLEALRAPGLEARGPVLALGLEDVFASALTVEAAPCTRISATRHDVRDFIMAVDRNEHPTAPPMGDTIVAIGRVAYRPTLTVITPWQRLVLEACSEARAPAELAAVIAEANATSPGEALAQLAMWLPSAAARGLVHVAPATSACNRDVMD